MAKDPAFLFYPNDYMGGTMGMTFEEKGAYMDLLVLQFNKGAFTIDQAKKVLNGSFEKIWPAINEKFVEEDGKFFNQRLEIEKNRRRDFTETRRQARQKNNDDAIKVYLIKDLDTGFFKIGSSINPLRRFADLCTKQNPGVTVGVRNYDLIWYSEVLSRTEEYKLHEKFSHLNVKGEWFKLSEADLLNIFNSYEGTYVNHTFSRMENENENRNESDLGKEKGAGKGKQKLDVTQEIPVNVLEAAEQNQWTFTKNRNTDFIKSIWKTFLMERVNDPPLKLRTYLNNPPELYQYFLNWSRNKFPKNEANKPGNKSNRGKSEGAYQLIDSLKDDLGINE